MALTRRNVMAVLAGGAFASSVAGCAPAVDPAAAWRNPGAADSDVRRFALAHAILAPNPHNRQPWLVTLIGDDELLFFADLERLLPETDPFDRQICVGCGAFLELLSLAAGARGMRTQISLWPQGQPQPRLDRRPVARVRFVSGGTRDPLYEQIVRRRTNREPYEARAVPPADLEGIIRDSGAAAHFADGGDVRDALRQLAWAAFETEFSTPAAYLETVNLIRVGSEEIAAHRDGIAIEGLLPEIGKRLGLVSKETLANIDNPQTRQALEAWRPLALDAPAFVWMTTPDNSRATQIAAGRAYARMNLAATARGLSVHPWSQALQEYPEMAAHYVEAERLMTATQGESVQMLARVGYGPEIAPAPRRGLSAHLDG